MLTARGKTQFPPDFGQSIRLIHFSRKNLSIFVPPQFPQLANFAEEIFTFSRHKRSFLFVKNNASNQILNLCNVLLKKIIKLLLFATFEILSPVKCRHPQGWRCGRVRKQICGPQRARRPSTPGGSGSVTTWWSGTTSSTFFRSKKG